MITSQRRFTETRLSSGASRDRRDEVVWIGDARQACFVDVVAALRRESSLSTVESVEACRSQLRRGASPRWIVFGRSRRGEFRDGDVARLHAQAPMARLLEVVGPWCEGEMRTGAPLDGVERVYWRHATTRLTRLWRLRNDPLSRPPLRTYNAVDRSLAENPSVHERPLRDAQSVGVAAHCFAAFDAIRCGLRSDGWDARWINAPGAESPPPEAPLPWLIWDAPDWRVSSRLALRDAMKLATFDKTLLLLGWPRPEDVREAEEMGVDVTLSKPFHLADLLACLG